MNSNYVSAEVFSMVLNHPLAPLPVPQGYFPAPTNYGDGTCVKKKAANDCCDSITMQDMYRAKEALCKADKKGNNPMRSNNEIKNYFADRAETVFYDLDRGLQKQFGLKDDAAPRTAADLVARIQAGKYVLPVKDQDFGPSSITWRDPSVVKDTVGYDTAYKALKTQRTATNDQIMSDETKALGAVDAFEAWTFTAPVVTPVTTA